MIEMRSWQQLFGVAPALCAGLLLAGVVQARAAVRTVRKDGTGNYTTIQACVNAMSSGDTCLVGAGVYQERIRFPAGKSGQAGNLTTVQAEVAGTVDTWGFDTVNCNYLRIQGFNITVPATQTGLPDGTAIAIRSSNLEVINNYAHDIPYVAFYGLGNISNVHVAGNRIYNIGMGIIINGTGWLVEANEIERLQYYPILGDADYIILFGANHVIRSNYLHGTIQAEIGPGHVDGFSTWDNNGEFVQHIRIEGNRLEDFYHQGFIAAAAYHANSFDIVICNNVFRAATAWGVLAFNGIREVKVYNNLFLNVTGYAVGINSGATGEAKNNIFYNSTGWDASTPASYGTKNIWYKPGGSVGSRFTGDLLNVDPMFVSVAGSDFHLRAGSPAIDAGVSLTAVPVDMDSVARPQGAGWDIGLYEFVLTAPAARLLSPTIQGANFIFTLSAGAGLTYRIDASSNLTQWLQTKTVTLATASVQITNPVSGPRRFYRAVLLP